MTASARRLLSGAAFVVLLISGPARGQIGWNFTYADGAIQSGGYGFADGTVVGSTTVGQLRRDSVTAAVNYLGTVLDGRGTVEVAFGPSFNDPGTPSGTTLANFAPHGFADQNGSFQAGAVYQRARTDTGPFSLPADGTGRVNFNSSLSWHYAVPGTNTTLNSNTFDLVSVLAHEVTHGLGFLSLADQSGRGLNGSSANPDIYSPYNMFMQQGAAVGSGALFRTDVTQSNYGSFIGPASAFTGGNENPNGNNPTNNATTGLYFRGPLAVEVFGGPVPLFAPATYLAGSSQSHVNVGGTQTGLMNYAIGKDTARGLQSYEIAMLMDMGWNVYNWNNTTGNWLDGVSSLANSRWRTDRGITLAANETTQYNVNASQNQAPVLPVYGQVTSNIVLNFGGSGAGSYTSTNDIGTVRLARLNLNSTSTNTTGNTITGGTLLFGQNSDGSASIVAPKIVQQNTGRFVVASNVQIPNGLTVDGTGSGDVAISGQLSGAGGLTKSGNFALALTAGNTYSGGTTVSGGTLRTTNTTGSATGTGTVTVAAAGTLAGTGAVVPDTGAKISNTVTVAGNVQPGSDTTTGYLTIGSSSANGTVAVTGTYTWSLSDSGTGFTSEPADGASDTNNPNNQSRLVVNGDLTMAPTTVYVVGLAGLSFDFTRTYSWRVATATGTVTTGATQPTFSTVGLNTGGGSFQLSSGVGAVLLSFAPVPEPVAILGLCLLAAGVVRHLRGRRAGGGRPAFPLTAFRS